MSKPQRIPANHALGVQMSANRPGRRDSRGNVNVTRASSHSN